MNQKQRKTMKKLQMALWRVLDLYKRDASRCGQAPAKQTHLNSDKKVNSKPSETGRSPLNRLANRPIILRSSAYFEFYSFYNSECFRLRFVSSGVSLRRPFLLPKIHFAAIPRSLFAFTKTIVNGNFPLKLHFEPFTLFLWSVVRLNYAKRLQKLLYFFQGIISKSQKSCEFG